MVFAPDNTKMYQFENMVQHQKKSILKAKQLVENIQIPKNESSEEEVKKMETTVNELKDKLFKASELFESKEDSYKRAKKLEEQLAAAEKKIEEQALILSKLFEFVQSEVTKLSEEVKKIKEEDVIKLRTSVGKLDNFLNGQNEN